MLEIAIFEALTAIRFIESQSKGVYKRKAQIPRFSK